jgi:N-acetylglucosaminyldiphosphoundecaprenol N-acetyl-beta-D-mannosaminyltransferase
VKENVMGVYVNTEEENALIELVFADIDAGQKGMILAVNPEKIIQSKKNEEVKTILNEARYTIPDGIGVLIASKWLRGKIKSRITGVDMMEKLVAQAEVRGKRIGMYGAKPDVIERAAEELMRRHPNLIIAAKIDGYEKDDEKIKAILKETKPDILFVALGSPKQERWMRAHMAELEISMYQGVGGSFDVLAGEVKRAPKGWQKLGLEWLYRLIDNPKRIKRQMNLVPFLFSVIFHKRG